MRLNLKTLILKNELSSDKKKLPYSKFICKRSDNVEMILSSQFFFQKSNKQILLYYYESSGQLVFVRFLEEIEDTKKTF